MTTAQHLEWLLKLLSPPYTANWKAYVWDRAKAIARDPQHADLPRMLTEAMHDKDTSTSTETSE